MKALKEKLKGLKRELKQLSKVKVCKDIIKKQEVLAEIVELGYRDEDETLEKELRMRRMELLSELGGINERELAIVIQKSRVNLLKNRDKF